MAANNSRDVKMTLSVDTLGADDIKKLQSEVAHLAKEGGDAAPEFQKLADEIARLGDQAAALRSFQALSNQTTELANEQGRAALSTLELRAKLDGLEAATKRASAAQATVAASLEGVSAASRDTKTAIELLALNTSKAERADAGYKAEKDGLAATLIFQKAQVMALSGELTAAKAVTKAAGEAEAKLAEEYRRSAIAATAAVDALKVSHSALDISVQSANKLGVATDNVALAQAKLVQSLNQTGSSAKQASDKLSAAAIGAKEFELAVAGVANKSRNTAVIAEEAAQKIKDAFQTVGVRSAQDLQAEITRVRAAMETVRASAATTGSALTGAFSAGEARINALEREIRSVSGTLTTADKAADLFKNSLGQIAAGNIIADGVGYLVNKVKELGVAFFSVNIEFQKTSKALGIIYKDAGLAASQFEFVRKAADKAGVSVGEITGSFVKFAAATQASGVSLQDTNALFTQVTRAAGQLNLSAEDVNGVLNALAQVASKGTLHLEELTGQIGDRLPGALSIAAKGFAITEEKLLALTTAGSVQAPQFFRAFEDGLKKTFGGGADRIDGFVQSINRLKNEMVRIATQASDTTLFKLMGAAVDGLTSNLSGLTTTVGALAKVFIGLKAINMIGSLIGFSTAAKGAQVAIEQKAAAVVQDAVATKVNTDATVQNTAAKVANAAAWGSIGLAVGASTAKISANADAWGNVGTALVATSTKAAATTTAVGGVSRAITLSGVAATSASVAKGALSASMGVAATAARGLVGVLGGLPGVIVTLLLVGKDLGTWLGETAAKFGEAGAAMKRVEIATAELAKKEADAIATKHALALAQDQLNLRNSEAAMKATAAAVAIADTSEKALAAKKAEAAASEALAKLTGIEGDALDKATLSAVSLSIASEDVARTKLGLIDTTRAEIVAIESTRDALGKLTEKQTDQLTKLKELLASRTEDAKGSVEAARLAKLEAAERKVASESYRDNAARIDEFSIALGNAKLKLETLKLSGVASLKQIADAETDVAKAARLVSDALTDSIAKIDRVAKSKSADIEITKASVSVAQQHYDALAKQATSQGNLALATDNEVLAKREQIKTIELSTKQRLLDVDAEIKSIETARLNLKTTGDRRIADEQDLDTRKKLADAKKIEISLGKEAINSINNEIEALQLKGTATQEQIDAYDRMAIRYKNSSDYSQRQIDMLEREAAAIEKVAEATRKRLQVDKDGFSVDKSGSRIVATESQTQLEKRVGAAYGADFAKDPRAIEAANIKQQLDFLRGAGNSGTNSREVTDLLARFSALESELRQAKADAAKPVDTGTTASTATTSSGKNVTVNINLGGNSTSVNVASDADAKALTAFLRGLESAKGVTV